MNTVNMELWRKIASFSLDEEEIAFTFTDRLARENSWSKEFSKRAVEEYRKFLYLCCVSDQQITPSDEVDQVWHLHLTYTRSYWKKLCTETLGRELHHNPTKGGKSEAEKFDGNYSRTLRLYHEHFEEEAPADIWPVNSERFGRAEHVRIDKLKFWCIRKPHLRIRIAVTVVALMVFGMLNIAAKAKDWFSLIGLCVFLLIMALIAFRNRGKGDGSGGGCSVSGCGSSHSDGGCSSHGCSGCSSGCGGGCGGD